MTALAGPGALTRPGGPARSGWRDSLAGSGALAKLAVRRDRIMLAAWIYVLAILVVSTGYSFKGLYKTAASREAIAVGIGHDATTRALGGPLYGDSIGALTVYKVGAATAIAAGLMSIFIVIRHTRADEEAGRLELVGSTAVGRGAALAVGVLLAAGANAVVALLIFAGLAAIGLPPGGSAALGLAIGTCGLVFAGVAAVTAQLSGTARGARGIAIGVLAAAYLVMSAGAAAGSGGARWLLWASPVGWVTQVRAYTGDRWLVLALPVAAAAVIGILAAVLAARRDLDAGLVPPRPGPAQAPGSLRSPLALAWRLQRAGLIGWAVGALLYGAALGSIAPQHRLPAGQQRARAERDRPAGRAVRHHRCLPGGDDGHLRPGRGGLRGLRGAAAVVGRDGAARGAGAGRRGQPGELGREPAGHGRGGVGGGAGRGRARRGPVVRAARRRRRRAGAAPDRGGVRPVAGRAGGGGRGGGPVRACGPGPAWPAPGPHWAWPPC